MRYVATGAIAVFFILNFLYYRKLYPPTQKRLICVSLVFIGITIAYLASHACSLNCICFPALIFGMMAALCVGTSMNALQSAQGSQQCVVCLCCFRGMFFTILALFTETDCNTLLNRELYNQAVIFAIPVALLFLGIMRKKCLPDQKMKLLLNDQQQLVPIVVYQVISSIACMVLNAGRALIQQPKWYCTLSFFVCSLTVGMLFYIMIYSIRSIELTEYKWSTKLLEEQNALQLRHYMSYEKYIENFRAFQHDHKRIMPLLKILIENDEKTEALNLIKEASAARDEIICLQNVYSNEPIPDAILQEIAWQCEEENIRFQCEAIFPLFTELSTVDALRIITNLSSNAIEACLKVPPEERFLNISCWSKGEWATLKMSNSYDGMVVWEGDRPTSRKKDKNNHGLGISSVVNIVEKMGGLLVFNSDQKRKIFAVTVHIPANNSTHNET